MLRYFAAEFNVDLKNYKLYFFLLIDIILCGAWIYRSPQAFIFEDYQIEFYRIFFLIINLFASISLSDQVGRGTIKLQFLNTRKRVLLLNVKLLLAAIYLCFFWIANLVLNLILLVLKPDMLINFSDLFNFKSFLFYILTGMVIFTFAYMISIFLKNRYATVIVLFFVWLLPYNIMPFVMYSINMLDVMEALPIVIILRGVNEQIYQPEGILILCFIGILFYLIGMLKYKKMEV